MMKLKKRIRTFLNDMFKAMGMEVKIDIDFDDPECKILNFLEKTWVFLLAKEVKHSILSSILQALL